MSAVKTSKLIISFLFFLKKVLRSEKEIKMLKLSSMVWSKIFMFLNFSYEILSLVKEEAFKPMEEGKGKLLFFACMVLSEILSCQTLNRNIMLLCLQTGVVILLKQQRSRNCCFRLYTCAQMLLNWELLELHCSLEVY